MASSSSSSVTTTTASSPPAPSSGGSGENQNNQPGSSPSLYLFTFLAILFLLLLISSAIIFRSFVLRRRFRRRMEEALAAGAMLPLPSPRDNRRRRNKKDFGEKPIIYDTWVISGGEKWEYMMPMAAQITPNKQSSEPAKGGSNNVKPEVVSMASSNIFYSDPLAVLLRRSARRGSPTPSPRSGTVTPNPSSNLDGSQADGNVQVSVLVAMPSAPNSKPKTNEDGAEIPDVVIGVAQMPYRTDNKGPPAVGSEAT